TNARRRRSRRRPRRRSSARSPRCCGNGGSKTSHAGRSRTPQPRRRERTVDRVADRTPPTTRAALGVLAMAPRALLACRWTCEPDLFWHLAQGREIAAGHLVRTNIFSATFPDHPQPSTSWLFDLGTYALWQIGGATAVQTAQALLIALTLA